MEKKFKRWINTIDESFIRKRILSSDVYQLCFQISARKSWQIVLEFWEIVKNLKNGKTFLDLISIKCFVFLNSHLYIGNLSVEQSADCEIAKKAVMKTFDTYTLDI